MACTINLRTNLLTGADTGGVWTYDGFSLTVGGPYDRGDGPDAGDIDAVLIGDNPEIDPDSDLLSTVGFYSFTYTGGTGPCEDSVTTILSLVRQPNPGSPASTSYCEGSGGAGVNLLTLKNTLNTETVTDDDLVIDVNVGSDDPGVAFDGTDTLDIEELSPGTYIFDFTKSVTAPGGYSLDDCPECSAVTVTLTITIEEAFAPGTNVNITVCAINPV